MFSCRTYCLYLLIACDDDLECSSRTFIKNTRLYGVLTQTSLGILTSVVTSNPIPKNTKNNLNVDENDTFWEVNYRRAVMFFYRQLLISHTFSTNSVHWVSNLVKNKLRKRTISSINTHFKVMTTYEKFQSSTKIISQENLIYVGEIFITVHTAVIKQICSILSVAQESTH